MHDASRERNRHTSEAVLRFFGIPELESALWFFKGPVQGGDRIMGELAIVWLPTLLLDEFSLSPDEILLDVSNLQTPNWLTHPGRIQAEHLGFLAVPFGIFVDGAAFAGKGAGTRQSLVGYYCNIVTQRRRRTFFFGAQG